jgi:hypothetical protein
MKFIFGIVGQYLYFKNIVINRFIVYSFKTNFLNKNYFYKYILFYYLILIINLFLDLNKFYSIIFFIK